MVIYKKPTEHKIIWREKIDLLNILVKILNAQDTERMLKVVREKEQVTL